MINFDDLLEMKFEAEKYGGEAHSFVCHPDNCDLIYKHAKTISGKNLLKPQKGMHLFGMPVVVLPSCPKDKIYVLSKDMVDRIRKTIFEEILG